jgi:DNA-binding transcriptional regulator YiaG
MWAGEIRQLRTNLRLSRSELARFLGVSEPTVVRWESDRSVTQPKGLQAVLLQALADAMTEHTLQEVARIVRSCGINHRDALRTLLAVRAR